MKFVDHLRDAVRLLSGKHFRGSRLERLLTPDWLELERAGFQPRDENRPVLRSYDEAGCNHSVDIPPQCYQSLYCGQVAAYKLFNPNTNPKGDYRSGEREYGDVESILIENRVRRSIASVIEEYGSRIYHAKFCNEEHMPAKKKETCLAKQWFTKYDNLLFSLPDHLTTSEITENFDPYLAPSHVFGQLLFEHYKGEKIAEMVNAKTARATTQPIRRMLAKDPRKTLKVV